MLRIHRAERADLLVAALGDELLDPLDDPFAAEIVSVPTQGVERWLSQQLSLVLGTSSERRDGVCANIEFPFPGHLVGKVVAAVSDPPRVDDPWLPKRLVWPLIDVVDGALDEPWLASLAGHLRGERGSRDATTASRRFATLLHLADLFDRYGVHRPQMIDEWVEGRDTDGHGEPLPEDFAWQAELWRRLRDRVGVPSAAELNRVACQRLRDDPTLAALPRRLSLFGLTRLPASFLRVLAAVGEHREVYLWLLHPGPGLWDRIAELGARDGPRPALIRRAEDPTAHLARHPLLATWGQDAREMQLALSVGGPFVDQHHTLDHPASTLLARLQSDVRADAEPAGPPLAGNDDRRFVLAPSDRSVEVHACHGRSRQVEALRDAIFHLLDEDPTLEPRDIIVMCPDIDTFAPLIHATFGLGPTFDDDARAGDGREPAGMPSISVRLADRSLRQTNPMLGALSELLDLTGGRLTASQVVDFASRGPVRQRFRLDDDDVARIEEWIESSGVRWGIDAPHREAYKLAGVTANTWRSGIDRLLVGVALAEDDLPMVGGTLPLDDVDSGDIDLAGRLAELIDRLHAAIDALAEPMSIAEWTAALRHASDSLMAARPRDGWQRAQLQRVLDEVEGEASSGGSMATTVLTLGDVRSLLADRLRGRPTRANFRTGHITMCTLVPMRSVPHRVVCLLGLDDGVFPRKTAPDGDDLLRRTPCVGDRDVRSEDRQLLLDAILAATDRLIITYAARDERTNAPRPPAVPLGELLDVVDRTARVVDGPPARERIVVHHPLQPFDARNFESGALVPGAAWSFDPVALGGAVAAASDRQSDPPFLTAPLPALPRSKIELDDLVRFVQHPVNSFLRLRLGISLRDPEDEAADAIPVELDSLERWAVGQRLLEMRLAGADSDLAREAEVSRGQLPPGHLGVAVLDKVMPEVDRIVDATVELFGDGQRRSVTMSIDVGDGRSLIGTVPEIIGHTITSVTYSRLGPKQRLAAWVRLLALTASGADARVESISLGKGNYGKVGVATVAPVSPSVARAQLSLLLDLFDRGMSEPLPIYCKSSAAFARAATSGDGSAVSKARAQWETKPGDDWEKEDREHGHQLVLGGVVPFEHVIDAGPRHDERGEGWSGDEPSRFGRYAVRLWSELLANERVRHR